MIRSVIICSLSLLYATSIPSLVCSQTKELHQKLKTGELESSLRIFNLWGEQPAEKQEVLKYAYEFLSQAPNRTFAELSEQPEFQKLCEAAELTRLGGPMLGSITDGGVSVWLRTLKPASVEVRVQDGEQELSFGPIMSSKESDLTAVVPVTGLMPEKRYSYRVLIDGKQVSIPAHAAIVTAPKAAANTQARIVFGSCSHRWGLGNQRHLSLIREREPSAMLFLGDIAVQDRNNHLGLHRTDYFLRDLMPAWQDLVATVPVFATWDDHDYFNNDKAGIPKGFTQEDKQAVCDVFQEAWNNPSYGFNDERRGIFLRSRIGPCDLLMVDNRYFRENKKGSFLGDEQLDWLEEQLLDCQGPFIVMSCGSMWSDYVSNGKDSWGAWDPKGRERIFRLIEENQIAGVILVSGDRHGARGFRIPRPSGFSFYEFEAASLGGRLGPPVTKDSWNTQLYGIADQYAFGELTLDATKPDPEVTFRLVSERGHVIQKITLTRSSLTPKRN